MDFFANRVGRVVTVPESTFPMTLTIEDWEGFEFKAIVTSLGVSSRGNFQFLHTLRNFIYLYVFGDRIGDIVISGLAFPGNCLAKSSNIFGKEVSEVVGSGEEIPKSLSGIELVWDYYLDNRISRTGGPVNIAIGTTMSFQAFLCGVDFKLNDPSTGIVQFTMVFKFFPPVGGNIQRTDEDVIIDFPEDEGLIPFFENEDNEEENDLLDNIDDDDFIIDLTDDLEDDDFIIRGDDELDEVIIISPPPSS